MKILSVDTSSRNCSVAIIEVNDNKFNIIDFKNNDDEKTHSQKLMPMISKMFEESKLSLNDIDLLACCVGPGSFTGIRIGVASIKAFADAKNIPVVGVTSLESLTYNISDDGYIIPILDAKHENIYSALFSHNNDTYDIKVENIADNVECVFNKFITYINSQNNPKNVYFVGDGSIIYKDLILDTFKGLNINFSSENIQSSVSLAKCAYDKYKDGIYGDSNFISPLYLRKSQAERFANGEK